MNAPVLTVPDVLEAFDAWDYETWRPASRSYGAVMMYGSRPSRFEALVRAVLQDQGIDPDVWERYGDVVEAAYREWLLLDAPYVRSSRGAA